jgi:hypothetical protein
MIVTLDKQRIDREEKLAKIEEPLKKLLADKVAMQEKIDQKLLDRCTKFLSNQSEDNIVYIMSSLIGIFSGQQTSDARTVELYLKKLKSINMALDRIDFKAQTIDYMKNLLRELMN